MGKHRHKQHYRRPVVAALAVGAIAIPSVAMACSDWPGDEGREHRNTATVASERNWADADWYREWSSQQGGEPSAAPSQTPTATASASKSGEPKHRGGKPWHKPRTTAPTTAPAKPTAGASKPATGSSKPTAGASKPATGSSKPTAAPSSPAAKPTATAPSSTPTATAPASGAVARVVELVNAERSKAGCSPVTVNATLTKAAQAHSEDMAAHRNMSHTGSDGSSPADRITGAGYNWRTYGENVAYGYDTPEKVMAGWMSSTGHRENILNCEFKEIGVGLAQPGSYWTQDFGTAR
ncbi:CAP domain-containing protein [Streptomyces sp. TRM S81-3]|uniref:CAP domain-containing protein n=1 Tax=Streptomyces griseicoloratus TaxID=2752516 RepID=A0A926LAK9_9ACTN|nr:CAP domain-containing protein [Streptomyces griseicoloratus]MBD0424069.1 CAP domain-containing protein [Streptomyces griseicoloratus]